MEDVKRPRLALLVDGDQHLTSLRAIREAAAAQGTVSVSAVFADWRSPGRGPWERFARRSGYEVVQVAANAKNAVDDALVSRVKSILAEGGIDGFWIASSDRDFTAAARLIKGSSKTVTIVLAPPRFPKDLQPNLLIVDPSGPLPEGWINEASATLRRALWSTPRREGRVHVSELTDRLSILDPEFSPLDFGFATLIELLESLPGEFRVHRPAAAGAVFVEDVADASA